MSMSHIKQKIESNDFVVTYDTNDYDVVEEINGIDKTRAFRELIGKLQRAGAEITIYYNGRIISLEIIYLIFDYPHKHYTFKRFKV